jgi:hypothetical protein
MAAIRKLALSVLVLAACGCVATAGAMSQPQQLRFSAARPSLRVQLAPRRPLAEGAYTGTLRVVNRGDTPARVFVTVRGGTGVVLREARGGHVLFRGSVALDTPTGVLAAGAARTLSIELRPAGGARVAVRVSGSAL